MPAGVALLIPSIQLEQVAHFGASHKSTLGWCALARPADTRYGEARHGSLTRLKRATASQPFSVFRYTPERHGDAQLTSRSVNDENLLIGCYGIILISNHLTTSSPI